MSLTLKLFTKLLPSVNRSYRTLKLSAVFYKKTFTRPAEKFSKSSKLNEEITENSAEIHESSTEDDITESEYNKLVDRAFRVPDMGHNVFVIQPYIKWGKEKKRNTTPALQLDEACSLINTLTGWTVADKITISLLSLEKTTLFGTGNLEKLQQTVRRTRNISAVFISVDILKGVQREALEKCFRVPVYDRYAIVIQIFREHAVSREAKLQIKLAELPYLRGTLKFLQPSQHFVGAAGETYAEFQRNLLKERERKIKIQIDSLRKQRDILRKNRQKSQLPVVAVVGYTNAGKTSLIKALTEEEAMMPKNVLFATLDVTVHAGRLPSGMKVLYIDTIGFISDIPTSLLESFVATLEDALLADVIVHVRDVSHPDAPAQDEHVLKTLQSLNLEQSLIDNIIQVNNKIDLVEKLDEEKWPNSIATSVTKLVGIDSLKDVVEEAVVRVTGRRRMQVRVATGGEEYQWLNKEAILCHVETDEKDAQYCIMHLIISPEALAKFSHKFIKSAK